MKSKKFTIALIVLCILFLSSFAGGVFAYFLALDTATHNVSMEVNQLFGILEGVNSYEGYDSSADWGTEGNPYLINESRHLYNLYNIQNIEHGMFNEDTVFVVANSDGTPACVQPEDGAPINSIGSEDFPFISTLKGVYGAVTLPSGETCNVSCIYGFTVNAYEGQIDVGLFGNVGDKGGSAESPTGCIQDLLLYDISIVSTSTGGAKDDHPNYQASSETDHETNHIGILAGHAENCTIKNISVYYSSNDILAFSVDTTNAAYTSAGGILGYYKDITIADTEKPVSSESNFSSGLGGGNTVGTGTGFMFSGDVMALVSGNPDTCDLQTISALYADNTNQSTDYFVQGVFTFAHSGTYVADSDNNDKIVKLWNISYTEDNLANGTNDDTSDDWYYTDGEYKESFSGSTVESYEYSIITPDSVNTTLTAAVAAACSEGDRVMAVYTYDGKDYVMTWDGATLSPKPFEIITGETSYVLDENGNLTYDESGNPITTKEKDRIGIPYTEKTDGTLSSNINNYSFKWISDNGNMRLSFGDGSGNYLAFNYTATNIFITYLYSFTGFSLKQSTDSESRQLSYTLKINDEGYIFENSYSKTSFYISQNGSNGLTAAMEINSDPLVFTFYRIDISSFDKKELKKLIYTPTNGGEKVDLSQNVLFYSGNASNGEYRYELKSFADLNWLHIVVDGEKTTLQPLTYIDTALIMARAVNFRNTSIFGFTLNKNGLVAVPLGDSTGVQVPKGSVAFQVQGTGIAGDTAYINVIVATNPSLGINQTIGCYKMESGGILSYNDPENNIIGKFLLPAVPTATAETTLPITLVVDGKEYTAYTNLSTVLVAYTFEIDCEEDTVYYLAANSGAASFVYFSVDSVAADGTRNTEHENNLYFPPLNGVDYVYKMNTQIILVDDNASYVQSLIMPYVGMYTESEPDENGKSTILISDVAKLEFRVRRRWALSGTGDMEQVDYDNYGIYSGEYGVLVFTNLIANGEAVTEDATEEVSRLVNYTDGHYVDDNGKNVYSDKVIYYTTSS
ncbi:MAG: hypothetical protein ACI4MC_05190 [Candidatus Coproplasma sp.]